MNTFDKLCQHVGQTTLLKTTNNLLEWDERTLIPPRGATYRAEQVSYLAGIIHQRETDAQLGEWIDELAEETAPGDTNSDDKATIRELRRDYEKKRKLPQRLVEELSRAAVLGQQAWVEARKANDFVSFAPSLSAIIRLKREQADAVGYDRCRYDVLLDDFEPNARTEDVAQVLYRLRDQLVPIVAAIGESPHRPPTDILARHYPAVDQERFGRLAAAAIGFDFTSGRLDVTAHPFCTEIGPHDCRITTRYDTHHFSTAFFGILHEAGHGMYEQGLRADCYGLPLGSYVSLGIHESQSRMWENLVGRGRAFWNHFFPGAQSTFPESLSDVSVDEFHFAVNGVQPSLIRVEADEVTYSLHIIIRFELEQALIDNDLAVVDLPTAWNDKYDQYLGIRPSDDAEGVLQDVHWSAALFGYFPTYALGNLYASQFFSRAQTELGDLDPLFANGDFQPLLHWLRENIHRRGRKFTPAQLVEQVTESPLSHQPFIEHLRRKFGPLYGI